MKFEPKTEEQCQAEQLLAEGKYPFTVLSAETAISKSTKNAGKEMLKIKLNVHADDGYDYHVYDYVAPWFMAHKFRHLFYCLKRGADYEKGTVDPSLFVGLQGWCDVGIQKAKKGYGPKNTISDYVVEGEGLDSESRTTPQELPAAKTTADKEEDDVPF